MPPTKMDTAKGIGPPRLKMAGVTKTFGATRALHNVTLQVEAGEVHALIGENGAGKSTLLKILSGACRPDSGAIELEGQPFVPVNPLHARRGGIAMIYQELTLAPHLTVAENILLGTEPIRWGCVDRRRRDTLAGQALAELQHADIPLATPVRMLSIAEQQIVEIARALVGQPKVLLMDEPTSSLAQLDAETLFRIIARLRERGVSIVYISHFLEECRRVCDRFTVLRDGETVGSGQMSETGAAELIRLMVGREMNEIYPRALPQPGPILFAARGLTGRIKPRGASFALRAGEIMGLAGLVGAGRTETVRACFGLDAIAGGTVGIAGIESARRSPAQSLDEGVGLLSENRKEEGLMLNRSLADNMTLTRMGPFTRRGWIDSARQRQLAQEWMRRLNIRAREPGQSADELSGGNQQKVALARLLHHEAKILLLDEPTRGIDIGSKAEIYRLMGELAEQGKAILFISSYLPELLGVCHTIGVMCRGVSAVRPACEWNEHSIVAAAIGETALPGNSNAAS